MNLKELHLTNVFEALGIEEIYEDRILVLEESNEQTSKGGIILPTTVVKETLRTGIVLAVGPGEFHNDGMPKVEMKVEKGDRVVFGKYEGSEVMLEGVTYCLIRMLGVSMKLKNPNYPKKKKNVPNGGSTNSGKTLQDNANREGRV